MIRFPGKTLDQTPDHRSFLTPDRNTHSVHPASTTFLALTRQPVFTAAFFGPSHLNSSLAIFFFSLGQFATFFLAIPRHETNE